MLVRELKDKEMMEVEGGSLPVSLINAITKLVDVLYEIGEATGSAIKRLISGNYCPVN